MPTESACEAEDVLSPGYDEVAAALSFKRVIEVFANVVVECSVLHTSLLDNDALLTANFVR